MIFAGMDLSRILRKILSFSTSVPPSVPGFNPAGRIAAAVVPSNRPSKETRMAWLIGIDEAGYGPNLGPFVMTSVACQVPDELVGANLWQVLRSAVRKQGEADDGRLVIDDSKAVYSTARGMLGLERG